eukprot:augustus_masked-scaffold_4-processed-gene-13.2-mRNA-1 protein AED:1.00 eAED:1.00 QI:0/-1/0/0/-1/1/1/0/1075
MDIMTKIEQDKLESLKKAFLLSEEGLVLEDFTKAILTHLPRVYFNNLKTAEQIDLVSEIVTLFRTIDRNANGSVDWEEFSNYAIEQASLKQISHLADISRYVLVSNSMSLDSRGRKIVSMCYQEQLETLLVLENSGNKLVMYDVDQGLKQLSTFDVLEEIQAISLKRSYTNSSDINSMCNCYSQKNVAIVVSLFASTTSLEHYLCLFLSSLKLWCFRIRKANSGYSFSYFSALNLQQMVNFMVFDKGYSQIYLFHPDGTYSSIHFPILQTKTLVLHRLPKHKIPYCATVVYEKRKFEYKRDTLLVSFYGGKVSVFGRDHCGLFTIYIRSFGKSCGGYHKFLICSLSNTRGLCCLNHSNVAEVWKLSQYHVQTKLVGHKNRIADLQVFYTGTIGVETDFLISLDTSGVFMLWDVDVSQGLDAVCLSSFSTMAGVGGTGSDTVCPKSFLLLQQKLVTCDVGIRVFCDITKSTGNGSEQIKRIFFLSNRNCFVFVTSTNILFIWDATSAEVLNSFYLVDQSEFLNDCVSVCVSTKSVKLYIGDKVQHVKVMNIENGIDMKSFHLDSKHGGIAKLLLQEVDDLLFVISETGYILCLDDSLESDLVILRSLKNSIFCSSATGRPLVTDSDVFPELNFLVVCSHEKIIHFYNSEHMRLLNSVTLKNPGKVEKLAVWSNVKAIVILEIVGQERILRLMAFDDLALSFLEITALRSGLPNCIATFHCEDDSLIVGTDKGEIHIFMSQLLREHSASTESTYRTRNYIRDRRLFRANTADDKRPIVEALPFNRNNNTKLDLFISKLCVFNPFNSALSCVLGLPKKQYFVCMSISSNVIKVFEVKCFDDEERTEPCLIGQKVFSSGSKLTKANKSFWRLNFESQLLKRRNDLKVCASEILDDVALSLRSSDFPDNQNVNDNFDLVRYPSMRRNSGGKSSHVQDRMVVAQQPNQTVIFSEYQNQPNAVFRSEEEAKRLHFPNLSIYQKKAFFLKNQTFMPKFGKYKRDNVHLQLSNITKMSSFLWQELSILGLTAKEGIHGSTYINGVKKKNRNKAPYNMKVIAQIPRHKTVPQSMILNMKSSQLET